MAAAAAGAVGDNEAAAVAGAAAEEMVWDEGRQKKKKTKTKMKTGPGFGVRLIAVETPNLRLHHDDPAPPLAPMKATCLLVGTAVAAVVAVAAAGVAVDDEEAEEVEESEDAAGAECYLWQSSHGTVGNGWCTVVSARGSAAGGAGDEVVKGREVWQRGTALLP